MVIVGFVPVFTCIFLVEYGDRDFKKFKGAGGGGIHQDFLKIDFLVVSDREE